MAHKNDLDTRPYHDTHQSKILYLTCTLGLTIEFKFRIELNRLITVYVLSVEPELYFEGVAIGFIGDSPTRSYAFNVSTGVSINNRFIPLNFSLGYNIINIYLN